MRSSSTDMRSSRQLALVLVAAIAACSNQGGPGSTGTPAANSPAASPAATIIEDAGLETPLAPGAYTSRLFTPTLTLQLGEGWLRRNAVDERKLDLRRGPNGSAAVTFFSGIDFLQCGTEAIVAKPEASTIADAIAASTKLTSTQPTEVPVGARTGVEVRLAGGGDPVPEADLFKSNEYGCVLTSGDEPFPAEAAWVIVAPDSVVQLVFVDVGDTTVLIRGLALSDQKAHFDLVLDLLADASLG